MGLAGIGVDIEGFHATRAALEAGRLLGLRVEERRIKNPGIAALLEQAGKAGVRVEMVEDVRPYAKTAAPQGLVAQARPLINHSLESLVDPAPCLVIVLDHLEDPHNVGAIARSGLAAGATGLVVPARRAAPLGPTAFKAAAGALERLPASVQSSTADVVRQFKKLGIWTVGLTAQGEESLFGLRLLTEPVAIVVGGEGRGLGRLVEDRVDVGVRIPMAAGSESLNASVAAALALFEAGRVRNRL